MGHFVVIRHPEPNSYREQQLQRPHTSLIVNTTHVSTYGLVVDLICPALSETHSSVRALLAVSSFFTLISAAISRLCWSLLKLIVCILGFKLTGS